MTARALFLLFVPAFAFACASGGSPEVGAIADDAGVLAPPPDAELPADPCENHSCFPGSECSPADNSRGYACGECPAGMEGDGVTCNDIDGCADAPCAPGVECIDTPAPETGFECGSCPTGSEGDGETCVDIDGCADNPCAAGVTCHDIASPGTGYTCGTCPPGTEGDGETCVDIDGCDGATCFPTVACIDVAAPGTGYKCGPCPSGYTGDGETCTPLCEASVALDCGSSLNSTTIGGSSTDQVDQWACASDPSTGREIVFTFQPTSSGVAAALLGSLSADLDLLVVKEIAGECNAEDSLACVAGGYSGTGGTTSEFVRWNAEAGETYYIIVDGYAEAESSFTLQIGTATSDVRLAQISSGTIDFVEVKNHGACSVSLGGFSLYHGPTCTTPFHFDFPNVTVEPQGLHRAVETGVTLASNESSFGGSVCDLSDDVGFTALCSGSCDESTCNNFIDFVERDGDFSDGIGTGSPSCASMTSGPVDVSSISTTTDQSIFRSSSAGQAPLYETSDWTIGNTVAD